VPGTPATPSPADGPHQVRWLLRLHRPALLVWAVLVITVGGALLWLRGPLIDSAAAAWRRYDACPRANCSYDLDTVQLYKDVYLYTTLAVLLVPFLVAIWSGAALIGRELESGTVRLAWTQTVSPTRWLAARLALPAALVTTGTGLLVLLHRLAWSAGRGRLDTNDSWWDGPTFHANGPTAVAMALAGLAVGVLTGLLWRRALAALVTAAAAVAGLWIALALAVPHLWPLVSRVVPLGHSGSPLGEFTVGNGLVTADGTRLQAPGCADEASCDAAYARLHAVGTYLDYHPAAHFWPLQLTATALLLAVTALLTVAAFLLLRRRTATATARKEATA
ncbi:ABC transporter permease, partial [Streptomyces sp. NPDC001435]|uniref:ABC transporter permease n=1 Tax=Streptomyces sp. NPDC001435 TaxID=3364576 RepID=UPI00368FA91D